MGDLVAALRALAERVDLRRVGDHVFEFDEVPIRTLQSELIANLRRSPEQVMPLQTTFADRPTPWRVGMFCATPSWCNPSCDGCQSRRRHHRGPFASRRGWNGRSSPTELGFFRLLLSRRKSVGVSSRSALITRFALAFWVLLSRASRADLPATAFAFPGRFRTGVLQDFEFFGREFSPGATHGRSS